MNADQDERFLMDAQAMCGQSKDPNTQVGALVVGPWGDLRATGFNRFPKLICETPERMADRDMKLRLIIHAEMDAILSAGQRGMQTGGCTLYLAATDATGAVWGGPPCVRCTVHALQAGITKIVSRPRKAGPSRWHAAQDMAAALIKESGIVYREVGP